MAKAKKAASAVIDFVAPKKSSGALPSVQTTRMGDVGFDPRFDDRVKEQQRLNDLTTTVEKRASQEIPSIYLPDYEGHGYVSSMADRTAGGGSLIGINDVSLKRPVGLQAGQSYMFENPGQVWASGDTPARAIMMQAAAAKALTGKDPLYLPHRMAPTGSDFATMTGETMLSYAESNMGRDAKKTLNSKIKEFIPNWKGVDSPKSIDQFRSQPDATRKAIHAMMDRDFRNEGGLGIGEARLSIADPEQLSAPVGYLMNVGKIFADKPLLQQSGHASYPRGVPGEGLGRINDERSLFELYPKTFPEEGKEKVIRPLLLDPKTALSEYNKLPDVVEARNIADPKSPSFDDTRALQMKPYYGILTEDVLRRMGYAAGGLVDSAPEKAIKNTITDPQAFRMLDMDLANLALMSQQPPRRMAGGGVVNMNDGGLLQNAFRAFVPAQVRTFVGTLAGDESPITEKNFSNDELDLMRKAIMSSRQDRTAMNARLHHEAMQNASTAKERRELSNRGPSKELDQTVGYQHYPGSPTDLISDFSLSSDAAIRNTLGRFAYEKTPEGNLVAKDLYKFRDDQSDKTRPTSDYANMGTAAKLWTLTKDTFGDAGFQTLPSRTGNAFLGNKPGRPVNVNLGKAKFAHGGAVQRFDDGGEVSQSELDRMKFEIAQAQNPSSPVMQATPRSPVQDFIGTAGGYMDKAGKFVSEAIAPTAERHPVKHFLANMLLADSLKSAGTALQDYTGTAREADEDNPVRGVISKDFRNLNTSTEPLLDPRVLDVAGFATPVIKGVKKIAEAGAKALTPFAKNTAEMAAELYGSGKVPGMVAPNAYMAEPSAPKPAKALAPANEQGFYSPVEAAALNLQRKTGNGQAFLNDIMKGENVSSEEISGMGLDTFLKGRTNVTAAEVQDYIAQNKLGLGEARYGALTKDISESRDAFKAYSQELASKYDLNPNENISMYARLKNIPAEEIEKYERLQNEWLDQQPKAAKFSGYQLPGGENYREVVITLPTEGRGLSEIELDKINRRLVDKGYDGLDEEQRAVAMRGGNEAMDMLQDLEDRVGIKTNDLMKTMAGGDPRTQYRSSHWDEPNVLAHLRMSDRVTDGKKTLLVDEVQSDWHQAGRERGYASQIGKKISDEEHKIALNLQQRQYQGDALSDTEQSQLTDILDRHTASLPGMRVPDAPYKDDWYQLALRRAVKEAIDGGYDRVALPTGARVADRFKLTNQVDEIVYGKNGDIYFYKNGDSVQNLSNKKPEELGAIVGKEVAQKLLNSEPNKYGARTLGGVDLEVGGEGMKKYYDEIYPGYLKKFGKKYGASVGTTGVEVPPDSKAAYQRLRQYQGSTEYINGRTTWSEFLAQHPEAAKDFTEPMHYMDITPAMRKEFSTGIHMAKGGKVSFASNVDAMRHELNKRQ